MVVARGVEVQTAKEEIVGTRAVLSPTLFPPPRRFVLLLFISFSFRATTAPLLFIPSFVDGRTSAAKDSFLYKRWGR